MRLAEAVHQMQVVQVLPLAVVPGWSSSAARSLSRMLDPDR